MTMNFKLFILIPTFFTTMGYAEESSEHSKFKVAPLIESINIDYQPWTFQFDALLENNDEAFSGSGNVEIYDDKQTLIQKLPIDISLGTGLVGDQIKTIEKTQMINKLFTLHDVNNDGWKDLILSNGYDPLGLIITNDLYQFNLKQKKFTRIDAISGKGSISPDKDQSHCLNLFYKKYSQTIDYVEQQYCYTKDKNEWILVKNNTYPSMGTN